MKKTFKRGLSLGIVLVFVMIASIPAFAANTTAKLYETYADGMLFKQKEDFVLAGTAAKGSKISVQLKNEKGEVIDESENITSSDNIFNVTLHAPNGSFNEYTLTLFENGKEFDKLENVVFGELWLASGQSNMDLPLIQSTLGQEMQKKGQKADKWIRFLSIPLSPEYNSDANKVPYLPQEDIKGCRWFNGESDSVYGFSAVAFFFAEELFKTVNMPLGVVQSSVGGSTIRSWLSRSEIDESEVKNILEQKNQYITEKKWNEDEINFLADMTGNYNKKIHPLKNFRFSGMIWYQGESDIGSDYGEYSKQLELLQKSYSKLFKFNGALPLIVTQLAIYSYSDFYLQKLNIEFTDFQQADAASRAVTTIYDVPLTYTASIHAIHPLEKHQVGRRMAFCAEGLVYDKRDTYTAATVDSAKIQGNSIIVKLKNTGDALKMNGDVLRGFAVCGDDGIYLPAEAEIIAKDTVKIYSEQISSPVSASYAVSQQNQRSNLYSDVDGYMFPVSPFITNRNYQKDLWADNGWTDCDTDTVWRTHTNELTGFYDTWSGENAEIKISPESAFSGTGGLSVKSDKSSFSVSPVTTYANGEVMHDLDTNFKKFTTMSFKVRNNGKNDLQLKLLEIECKNVKISPRIADSKSFGVTIPADGKWYTITLDLNKIYYTDYPSVISLRSKLEEVSTFKFCFENSTQASADISIDDIEFSTEKTKNSFWDLIKEFFINLFNRIINMF